LGRPFYAVGTTAGLRSWSGSMFEYLMPTLVLSEPTGSVLHAAGCAALAEQRSYAAALSVPWGISESAHAGRDHTLAYQYAPQGVPRLALRRTPPDELVIAPYATALAAQLAPHAASVNYAVLQGLGITRAEHPSLTFLVRPWVLPSAWDFFLIASCGVVAAAGTMLLTSAYRVARAGVVAPFEYSGVLWAPLWGFLFFSEVPRMTTVAGAVLIVGAGLVALRVARHD
jgi:hypothetical protein